MPHSIVDLRHAALHLTAGLRAEPVVPFDSDYPAYLAAHCTADDPGRLVSMFVTTEDWTSWEVHPLGDEVVIVVSGRAEFLQEIGGTVRRTVVGPLEAIVNPAGVWHSANVIEPFTALYLTPGPGTDHRPREVSHV